MLSKVENLLIVVLVVLEVVMVI